MRKLILMAVAGYVWKKFRARDGRSHAGGAAQADNTYDASRQQRYADRPTNHQKTHLEGSTT